MAAAATSICLALIAFLFWRDSRVRQTEAISWAPFAWMFIAGSRFPSAWLQLRGPVSVEAYAEGNSFDRTIFLILILWGIYVLAQRKINWSALFADNKWLLAYLAYCLLSILWADDSVIVVKRWFKDLGNPIMALVLLTERRPFEALVSTIRRLSFILLPLSVLFVRYIPELGRGYSAAGGVMYSGAADHKNTLGLFCLVAGTCYLWAYLHRRALLNRSELITAPMLAWLMYMANSKTSLTCLILTSTILLWGSRQSIAKHPTRIIGYTLCGVLLYISADAMFDLQTHILTWLGRDATLTNRTEVWKVVRELQTNSLLGAGFMSFWSGDRMVAVWSVFGPGVNQAHNGYLEQYLNLGYVGVIFIIAIAAAALFKVRTHLKHDYAPGLLRFCFITAALLYNYTEASFYGINLMWVMLLVASVEVSLRDPLRVRAAARSTTGQLRIYPRGELAVGIGVGPRRRAAPVGMVRANGLRWRRSRVAHPARTREQS
jgi:exopolysaccharide production protein ExoQ